MKIIDVRKQGERIPFGLMETGAAFLNAVGQVCIKVADKRWFNLSTNTLFDIEFDELPYELVNAELVLKDYKKKKMMTTEEAKLQIEDCKDFATPAQIKALDMGLNALDEVERYKKSIDDIYTEISEKSDSTNNDPEGIATAYGFELALDIINKHTERLCK